MADQIKQSDNVGRVLPLNPSRGATQRQRRRPNSSNEQKDEPQQGPKTDRPHRVDEYV